jgi:hypothetical protein
MPVALAFLVSSHIERDAARVLIFSRALFSIWLRAEAKLSNRRVVHRVSF